MARMLAFLLIGAAVLVGVTIYFSSSRGLDQQPDQDAKANGFLETTQDFQDKLEELKRKRDMADLRVTRLDQRKNVAAESLKKMGVTTADQVESNPEAKLAYFEIKDIINSSEKLQRDIKVYDDAIVRVEAALRKLDRQRVLQESGIDEEQLKQLRTIVADVDDQLISGSNVEESFQMQNVLDDVLGKDVKTTDENSDDDSAESVDK